MDRAPLLGVPVKVNLNSEWSIWSYRAGWWQVASLQGQVASLEEKVASLVEKVASLEEKLTDVRAQLASQCSLTEKAQVMSLTL